MPRIYAFILVISILLTACVQSKPPSPEPQVVLAILRQYPGGTLIEERILENNGDVTYRISFAVQTTPDAAIANYAPLFRAIGMKENPSRGPTLDDLQVDYRWTYYGCPYHEVAMTTTVQKLQLTYTYGPCR